MSQRPFALTLVCLALGCSASATSGPALRQNEGGGAGAAGNGTSSGGTSGSGTSGSGGSPSGVSGSLGVGGHPGSSTGGSAGTGTAGAHAAGSGGSVAGSSSGGSGNTGPVTIGLPFTEDFESGTISSDLWTALAKQLVDPTNTGWSIVTDGTSKVAQLTGDSSERFLVGGNSAWTDQKIELRVKTVSGSPEIDVAFRFRAEKEYYYVEFANSHFKLRDRTSVNEDVDPTGDKPSVTLGTWYKLTIQIKGTAISAALNDMVLLSGNFASTPIAAGGIAIGIGSGTGVAQFDDIHVTLPQ